MFRQLLYLLVASFVVSGCTEGPLDFKVRFDALKGLEAGDRVLFEGNHIGDVTGAALGDDVYLVEVTVRREFRNAITRHADFFIVSDARGKNGSAVEVALSESGGTPISDGAILDGSTRISSILKRIREGFDKGALEFKTEFKRMMEEMKDLPESEQFKSLKEEADRLEEEMRRSGSSAQKKLQEEVLPLLQEKLEKLKKWFEEMGREKEIKPVEEQLEKLRTI